MKTALDAMTASWRRHMGDAPVPESTTYLGSELSRPIEHGITEAALRANIVARGFIEPCEHEDDSVGACIICGAEGCHINGGGNHWWAEAVVEGQRYLVHYCQGHDGTLLDGPHAGGFAVWRCDCDGDQHWPEAATDPRNQQDVLDVGGAASSSENVGDTCGSCGAKRGEKCWGLFD